MGLQRHETQISVITPTYIGVRDHQLKFIINSRKDFY